MIRPLRRGHRWMVAALIPWLIVMAAGALYYR
jgi:hypothetical protein